ncbi:MAG TPA: hypothetical protein VGM81_04510 [Burkholderiaceae bacterium]|jgi:hypothetical protein
MHRIIIAISAALAVNAQAAQPGQDTERAISEAHQQMQTKVLLERRIAGALAPVKTLATFYAHLNDGSSGMSAFARLPSASQSVFIANLTFNEKGLTGFNYRVLEDSLSVEEAYSLLSMFGVQHTVGLMRGLRAVSANDLLILQSVSRLQNQGAVSPTYIRDLSDHQDYQCISRGTCESSGGRICTDNC